MNNEYVARAVRRARGKYKSLMASRGTCRFDEDDLQSWAMERYWTLGEEVETMPASHVQAALNLYIDHMVHEIREVEGRGNRIPTDLTLSLDKPVAEDETPLEAFIAEVASPHAEEDSRHFPLLSLLYLEGVAREEALERLNMSLRGYWSAKKAEQRELEAYGREHRLLRNGAAPARRPTPKELCGIVSTVTGKPCARKAGHTSEHRSIERLLRDAEGRKARKLAAAQRAAD